MSEFFKQVERKTGVDFDEIVALANALGNANFKDERQVRKIVRKVGKMANRNVPREMEDRIVASIVQNGDTLDLSTIEKMLR